MGKVGTLIKQKPWILLVVAVMALVVYEVWKKTSGNLAAAGIGSSGSPGLTASNGASSQLGGYVYFHEDVINPTPVTINFNGKPKASKSHPSPKSPKSPPSPAHKKVVAVGVPLHSPPVHNTRVSTGEHASIPGIRVVPRGFKPFSGHHGMG